MASFNKVLLLGNLSQDPELRRPPGGSALCALVLAVSRTIPDSRGEGREETCWVTVNVWGAQAETCAQYLQKGMPALVEGRLHQERWEDRRTGGKMSRLVVQAERVRFVGPRAGREDGNAETATTTVAEAPAVAEAAAVAEPPTVAETAAPMAEPAPATPEAVQFEPVERVDESIPF